MNPSSRSHSPLVVRITLLKFILRRRVCHPEVDIGDFRLDFRKSGDFESRTIKIV
jgi:hypothetical protein